MNAQRQPAVLGLSRPTPYDVVLIRGLWTAQVLALRAAANGARVAVEIGRPQTWTQMVHATGGGPVAPRLVRQARLVGVQRVSPDEAAELGRAVGLHRPDVDALPPLVDGVTLWCSDRDRQYVTTRPTDAEVGLLGTPRRMD
ncbi:hypothetical protein SUDANB60_04745 [Streptomyces sp. enrichment culture]